MSRTSKHVLTYPAIHDQALAGLLNSHSISRLWSLDLDGRRVLEVGAGAGSMTQWFVDRVGASGYVFALDRKPRINFERTNMVVVPCDVAIDDFPGYVDVIHARLTLAHIPARRQVLQRLIEALKPGGFILIEDWWTINTKMVMESPSDEATDLYDYVQAAMGNIFEGGGTDRDWARRIHGTMRRAGLSNVHTTIESTAWSNGDWGTKLVKSSLDQLQDQLIAAGVTTTELTEIRALLDRPDFVLAGHPLYSTSGYKTGNTIFPPVPTP